MNKENSGRFLLWKFQEKSIYLINEFFLDEDTVIPDAAPLVAAKNVVPEVKTASPKQTPKGKKGGKKRR